MVPGYLVEQWDCLSSYRGQRDRRDMDLSDVCLLALGQEGPGARGRWWLQKQGPRFYSHNRVSPANNLSEQEWVLPSLACRRRQLATPGLQPRPISDSDLQTFNTCAAESWSLVTAATESPRGEAGGSGMCAWGVSGGCGWPSAPSPAESCIGAWTGIQVSLHRGPLPGKLCKVLGGPLLIPCPLGPRTRRRSCPFSQKL